jgi:O-antigen biosynthesis protein
MAPGVASICVGLLANSALGKCHRKNEHSAIHPNSLLRRRPNVSELFKKVGKSVDGLAERLYRSRVFSREFDHYKFIESSNLQKRSDEKQHLEKKSRYRIAFIVPPIKAYIGGHTSVLRLGTYLADFGHEVYYVDTSGRPVKGLAKNARINLPYYKGKVVGKEGLTDDYDIGVATDWVSAYHLNGRDNFSYKCYFVQDFEPAFFPLGDLYYLALNTYKFNFHMISLGRWNALQIGRFVDPSLISVIDFPIELKQFPIQKRKINITDKPKFLVYIKRLPKRAPILIFHSLALLSKALADRKTTAQFFVFGLPLHFKIPFGKNLGKVPNKELLKYYQTCDFGVVASYSNISLITFEMLASGLPVIEFKDGSAPTFFDDTQLVLCETSPADFVDKVLYYLDHQTELETMLRRAQDNLRAKPWSASARSFLAAVTGTEHDLRGEG